ncbi:MAG: tetratricopeptide (TPR) repeat protein [Gammaproteobacteria bacterium]|jgi:tetratricopeptide (TPR) repeat protein
MLTDSRGLDITCANQQALDIYETSLLDLWNYRLKATKTLKSAFELDVEFPMAHIVRGYIMSMLESTAVRPKMLASVAQARQALAGSAIRERLHADALEGLASGNINYACECWESILVSFPHDLLALKMHHHTSFWTGRSYVIRNTVTGVFDAWDASMPGYSFVLGMMCFGLEECGDYAKAEPYGRRAIDMNGDDLWAIHSVAHVLEMQGRLDEGITLLNRDPEQWADRNPFQGHNWWHLALFALEKGDYDFVMKIYDDRVITSNTEFFLDIQNGASLLKRLELQGVNVGARWDGLAEYAEKQIGDHVLSFTDLHSCIALAAKGKSDVLVQYLASLQSFAETPNNYSASITKPIIIPMCEGLIAFEQSNFELAVERLWPLREQWTAIGGSHAQRDVFTQVLIGAAIGAKKYNYAQSLLSQRLTLRPQSFGGWTKYAEVLSALGCTQDAQRASLRAQTIQ